MFISHVSPTEATGDLIEIYDREREFWGYLPNYALLFSHRPELWFAWRQLIGIVKGNMDPRIYELATLAAATALKSSYCSLAHGKALTGFYEGETIAALARDRAILPSPEAALMDFSAKVATDASAVTQDDVDRLRQEGWTDTDIFDVAAAVSARAFFATLLDALGAVPDQQLGQLDPKVVAALTVGRKVDDPRLNS
ncbi:MAG TPA: peroxidase [Acidimicrobiia bacterium]|nr:peroxidase [Acidimicrobiia bacterium]